MKMDEATKLALSNNINTNIDSVLKNYLKEYAKELFGFI